MDKDLFFDEGVDVARYDIVKYSQLQKLYEKMLSFYWTPDEIDVTKDKIDFSKLTKNEQHIFTSNLKRQILLDSVQADHLTWLYCHLQVILNLSYSLRHGHSLRLFIRDHILT